jgi:hypothetical protein
VVGGVGIRVGGGAMNRRGREKSPFRAKNITDGEFLDEFK